MAKEFKERLMPQSVLEMTVGNFYLYYNGVEIYKTTLSQEAINSSSDKTEVRSGTANAVTYIIPGEKTYEITLTDVCNDPQLDAIKNGSLLEKVGSDSALKAFHMPKYYDVKIQSNNVEITLDQTPADGENFSVTFNDKLVESSKVSVTTNKVTITNDTLNITGTDKVLIGGFYYDAPQDAITYNIAGDSKTISLSGVYEQKVLNKDLEEIFTKQTVYYKLNMSSDNSSSHTTAKEEIADETVLTAVASDEHPESLGYVLYMI